MTFPSLQGIQNRNEVGICVRLTCLDMKHDWNDGTKFYVNQQDFVSDIPVASRTIGMISFSS